MTGTEYTRRSAVALFAGVTMAGCSMLSEGSYWENPPSFDDAGLDAVTTEPVPDRPDPIPVTLGDSRRSAYAERVSSLLDPIPEPLTAEIVPNGEIRQEIVDRRTAAREALDRMDDTSNTLATVDAAASAVEEAAAAAAVWALITTDGSLEPVLPDYLDLGRRARTVRQAIPDVAAGPAEGAVVYGTVGEWVGSDADVTQRRYRSAENPLRKAESVGEIQHSRATVEAGEHVHRAYVDRLDDPQPVEGSLVQSVSTLGPRLKERLAAWSERDDDHVLLGRPDVETLVDRDYQDGEPGVTLVRYKLSHFYDTVPRHPLAWPDSESEYPALEVRNTTWALVLLEAIEALGARVDAGGDGDDGDDLFPADAATIRDARETAIAAIDGLGADGSPLAAWIAYRLVPKVAEADGELADMNGVERRTVADVYGEYVWLETVANAIPDVLDVVSASFQSE